MVTTGTAYSRRVSFQYTRYKSLQRTKVPVLRSRSMKFVIYSAIIYTSSRAIASHSRLLRPGGWWANGPFISLRCGLYTCNRRGPTEDQALSEHSLPWNLLYSVGWITPYFFLHEKCQECLHVFWELIYNSKEWKLNLGYVETHAIQRHSHQVFRSTLKYIDFIVNVSIWLPTWGGWGAISIATKDFVVINYLTLHVRANCICIYYFF